MTSKATRNPLEADVVTIPSALRQAIVRSMAKHDCSWEEACVYTALYADQGSRAFDAAVEKRAQELYKSKFMAQVNRARSTIQANQSSLVRGAREAGYRDGYSKGMNDYSIAYRCSVCDQPIFIKPWSEEHTALVRYMNEHGWRHISCGQ